MHARRSNQRGVAIPLVLGGITILAALATDFAGNSTLQLRMATNARDRLQAEYLAYSGLNFLRLELRLERMAKGLLPANLQGMGSGPLCKQYPLSTGLLKAIFIPNENEGAPDAGPPDATAQAVDKTRMVTAFDTEAAKEFLRFEGDFSGECSDEGGKLNLNVFAEPGQDSAKKAGPGELNTYDRWKEMLVTFVSHSRFKEVFAEDERDRIREVVCNIADWVDGNEHVNEKGGMQAGPETGPYSGLEAGYKIKNGKMATLDEVYLIAGVQDDWFTPLREYFTVYGNGSKVNLCSADPEVVEAVVSAYALGNPKFPTFTPENPELMKKVMEAVDKACGGTKPPPQKVAQEIEAVLSGVGAAAGTAAAPVPPPAPLSEWGPAPTSLADMIVTETRYYRIVGTGEIRRRRGAEEIVTAMARATAVVDIKENDPKKWKTIYWRVE